MRIVRIYKPSKTAMQSGKAKTHRWILEYPTINLKVDEINGWVGSSDMYAQEVKLYFASQAEAVDYANKNSIPFEIILKQPINQPKLRSYSSNYQN